ncbi:uncharacterized protein G2W53_003445 [Senna tora]|uniref:Uncharacterized protein n=1 Tax=Senna tora TaxID=362788 RepID=A0A834XB22_9FABA|nr:uncharacterized protein G2W53_003445 [Senna tora]
MTAITNFSVKSKEFLEGLRDIGKREEVADEEVEEEYKWESSLRKKIEKYVRAMEVTIIAPISTPHPQHKF